MENKSGIQEQISLIDKNTGEDVRVPVPELVNTPYPHWNYGQEIKPDHLNTSLILNHMVGALGKITVRDCLQNIAQLTAKLADVEEPSEEAYKNLVRMQMWQVVLSVGLAELEDKEKLADVLCDFINGKYPIKSE